MLLLAVSAGAPAGAQSANETLETLARGAARAGSVGPLCRRFYVVDNAQAVELSTRIATEGVTRFGAEAFDPAFKRATRAQVRAVANKGAAIWCPEQREFFRRMGFPGIVGGPL